MRSNGSKSFPTSAARFSMTTPMLFEFLDDCALAIGFGPSPAEVVQGRELGSDLLPGEVPVGFGYELPIDSDVLDPLRENANWNAADVNLARGVRPFEVVAFRFRRNRVVVIIGLIDDDRL